MAIASGVCVANAYYNQPILKDIASSFQVSESEAGSKKGCDFSLCNLLVFAN
ncbi:hypothetical protein [Nostoc sp. ChiQUE01b]|uniref:hypothetical protein n=1 Tax=Nostoc sp. ChiQUE01b TaxID=3075376 RepID=UPI002AD2CA3B|nr:hypothetical protein [Nostoc sp. ChiQUE01b]